MNSSARIHFVPAHCISIALGVVLVASFAPAQTSIGPDSMQPEPGVTYGTLPDSSLPKTILFSAGPDEIATDAEEWSKRGVSAFFLDFVAREWSSDIWATDGKPWTIGASDETFQKTKRATAVARRLGSEVFLKVSFDHVFEWFNDTAWQQIENNFRQFARFARDTHCHGIALDIEYIAEQYDYGWSGYDYRGYTRAGLRQKVHDRMTRVLSLLYDEFPDMIFLTFPEYGPNLGSVIHAAWIEEAARRHAPGGVHYCTERTYRSPNIRYMFALTAQCNELFDRLLSPRARRYWREKCSIAAGVWPLGFDYQSVHDPGLSVEEFRQGLAASLMVSRRYNWIYSHNSREQLLGRKLDVYTNGVDIRPYLKIMTDRQIVTTPKFVALAREIRAMKHRDYSGDLGLASILSLAGPNDLPTLLLMPATYRNPREQETIWRGALAHLRGDDVNFRELFAPQTDWLLLGPFPSGEKLAGHAIVYPPEQALDLHAEYDGVSGKIRWREHHQAGPLLSVDLTKVFQPTELVCAYALCFVTSPVEQDAQIRFGANDADKLWLGGRLLHDSPHESTALLDGNVIPVRLPKGATPVLLKVTNGLKNWGFVFRITDAQGRPLKNIRCGLTPAP